MAASQRVLQLPELVGLILQQLADLNPKFLGRAVMVNSLWVDVAINVKWQEPTVTALVAVPPPRRHLIARKVRSLKLHGSKDCDDFARCYGNFSFHRLQHLVLTLIGVSGQQSTATICQLVGPRLMHFEFTGSGEQLLNALTALCTPLSQMQHLSITWVSGDLDIVRVVRLLEHCPSTITTLSFYAVQSSFPDTLSLLLFCAASRGLRQLSLGWLIEEAALQAMVSAVSVPPFAALQRLHTRVHSTAVPLLASAIPRVQHLVLQILDLEAHCDVMMPAVATLRALRSLKLSFSSSTLLRCDELLQLRSLTALHSLELFAFGDILMSFSLNVACLTDLLAVIGQGLQTLELSLSAPRLDVGALRAIGEHCPNINTLILRGQYDLKLLGDSGPRLFSSLTSLSINSAVSDEDSEDDE
jgi:hypothetical protein